MLVACLMAALSVLLALNLVSLLATHFSAVQSAWGMGAGPLLQSATSATSDSKPQDQGDRQLGGIHPGSISGNVYTNPFFGISLEIPEGWKVADSVRAQAAQEKRRDEFKEQQPDIARFAAHAEVNMPLLVIGEALKRGRRLMIVSTNISTRPGPASAEEYLKYVATISKEKGLSAEYAGTMEQVMIGGHALWKAHFTETNGMPWYGEHFAVIEKKHVLQFVLYSPDQDGLRAMEGMMRTLHFEPWAQQDRQDVAGIRVEAERSVYSGICPLTVRFKATIEVDHVPVALSYWWERSDGTKTSTQAINIQTDGRLSVFQEDSWSTGIRRESKWEISDRIHVQSGDLDFVSDPAVTSLSCQKRPK